jgi:hypothetical protein
MAVSIASRIEAKAVRVFLGHVPRDGMPIPALAGRREEAVWGDPRLRHSYPWAVEPEPSSGWHDQAIV